MCRDCCCNGGGGHRLLSFSGSLRLVALFHVPKLSLLARRFVARGIFAGRHLLVLLIVTIICIVSTASTPAGVVSVKLRHDGCHGCCDCSLKSSSVYLHSWHLTSWLVASSWRHNSISWWKTSLLVEMIILSASLWFIFMHIKFCTLLYYS